jgi:predicted RNA-binding protein with TRAM domain
LRKLSLDVGGDGDGGPRTPSYLIFVEETEIVDTVAGRSDG